MATKFERFVAGCRAAGPGRPGRLGLRPVARGARAGRRHAATAPQAAASAGERKVLYWYDPMVPTQRFDKPGKSPFMDMQLVPRYADEGEAGAASGGTLAMSTQAQQALGLRLATVREARHRQRRRGGGHGEAQRARRGIVQARTAGFVERVLCAARRATWSPPARRWSMCSTPSGWARSRSSWRSSATGDAALTQAARAAPGAAGHAGGADRAGRAHAARRWRCRPSSRRSAA